MSDGTATTHAAHGRLVTTSGARVATVPTEEAAAFLARLGERGPDPIELALGARQDDGTLIGVAAFGAVSGSHGSLIVAVVPERRRLRVGSDLLQALVAEAARTGITWFLVVYPAHATAAQALVGSSGLTAARREDAGTVTAVLDATSVHPIADIPVGKPRKEG